MECLGLQGVKMNRDKIERQIDFLESRYRFYEESLQRDDMTTRTANKTKKIMEDIDDLISDLMDKGGFESGIDRSLLLED